MIGRGILICSLTIFVAVNVPSIVGLPGKAAKSEPQTTTDANLVSAPVDNSRSYTLRANEQGHFAGRFRINGKPLDALIDTGATFVTMTETTARNLGYGGNELIFRHEVATANGKVNAARIKLRSIEIGTVAVRDVDAIVIRGKAFETPLIGMSYLRKLSGYRAESGELRLVD